MAKVLLVEDDNNLREIYEARLAAEGYEISSAQDGEEALVVAKQAKPDLVISDVMMPKISGFEMLDILRNTPGLEAVKVIMLTALGQGEDRDRADSLGADKYLVKSQVTLEDIVKTAHELLGETTTEVADTPPEPTTTEAPVPTATVPVVAAEMPVAAAPEQAEETETAAPSVEPTVAAEPVASLASPATSDTTSVATDDASAPQTQDTADDTTSQVTTTPIPEPVQDDAAAVSPLDDQQVNPVDTAEESTVNNQITNFLDNIPADVPATDNPDSTPTVAAAPEQAEETEPAVVTPEAPTATEAMAASVAADATDDQLMADAIKELSAAAPEQAEETETAAPSVEPTPETPETEPAVIAPEAPTATPITPPVEADDTTISSSVSITGKKVIQPLSSEPKPDINDLLAKEEAIEAAAGTAGLASGPSVVASSDDDEQAALAALKAAGTNQEAPAIVQEPGKAFTPEPIAEPPTSASTDLDQPSGAPAPVPSEQKDSFDPNSVAL